jgi:glyoxylase-like metal-dependent hydrolase (beta-lactamase superfamily II)
MSTIEHYCGTAPVHVVEATDAGPTLHYRDAAAEIHRVVVGPVDNNVFVLRCRETGDAVLIDAANEHELLLELCQSLGVRTVVETHGHWDHIAAVPAVREAGYQVGVTAADAAMLDSYDYLLEDESVIEVGRLRLHTITTPGHTPGSICFRLEGAPVLFSGDTLFPGGPGATKFPGGNFDQIITSLDTRLFSPLPADTIVMPGHGNDTTIGTESPHLQEWVDRGW